MKFDVALVPPMMDLSPVDGVLDRATGLVSMRAVGEAAERDVGAELDEVALELAGITPQSSNWRRPGVSTT